MPIATFSIYATGDTIEAAWANDIRSSFLVVDARTGGDPPAADRVPISTSTSDADWSQVTTAALGDLAVTIAKMVAAGTGNRLLATLDGTNVVWSQVVSAMIAAGAVNTAALGDNAATAAKLVASGVGNRVAMTLDGTNVIYGQVPTDAITDNAVTYPKAASSFFLAAAEQNPSADYALTNSFADVTGCTVTTTRAGTYLVFLHVAFTIAGVLTTGVQFQARIQRTGSGTANSRNVPALRTPAAAGGYDIATACVVMTAPSAGDVFRLQALDSQASNNVEADYTWIVPVWIAP